MVFWKLKMITFEKKNICSSGLIQEIENHIAVSFPENFKTLISEYDGESPNQECLDFYDTNNNKNISTSAHFLSFKERWYGSLLSTYQNPPEFFPKGLIAFAEDGGGNLICFDYRKGKDNANPPIVFWNHEADIGKDISFIADSFDEFLSMLKSEEEIEALESSNSP